jgi:class 3 adenylate cyclase
MQKTYQWQWPMQAPVTAVWRQLRDTERFNKAAGLQVVQFADEQLDEGGVCRFGSFRFLGLEVQWREMPFEWTAPSAMSVERRYLKGPLQNMIVDWRLEATSPSTTTVHVALTVRQRVPLLWPVVHGQFVGGVYPGFDRALRHLDAFFRGQATLPWPEDAPRLGPDALDRQQVAQTAMLVAQIPKPIAAQVCDWVLTRPDREVEHISAYDWAAQLAEQYPGVTAAVVLRALLIAADHHLLELFWDLRCPHCRGGTRSRSLVEVRSQQDCLSCNVAYDAAFDQDIAVTFTPPRTVRVLDLSDHCVGGPGKTPHVVWQRRVAPGAEPLAAALDLAPGSWRLRSAQVSGKSLQVRVALDSPAHAEVTVTDEAWLVDGQPSSRLDLSPNARILLHNTTGYEVVVSVDDPAPQLDIVTGAQVAALQAFRARFTGEVVQESEQLRIHNAAFLFTDLRASTSMYEKLGDAVALQRVREHFDTLFAVVERNNGAVVKTIGDAVMAVFVHAADAVRAALEAVTEVALIEAETGQSFVLRSGIHAGPCLAVNLDQRLDYFGSTVNRAARVGAQSKGLDVVLAEVLVADPAVHALVADLRAERFTATLRGVPEPVALLRVWPDSVAEHQLEGLAASRDSTRVQTVAMPDAIRLSQVG